MGHFHLIYVPSYIITQTWAMEEISKSAAHIRLLWIEALPILSKLFTCMC